MPFIRLAVSSAADVLTPCRPRLLLLNVPAEFVKMIRINCSQLPLQWFIMPDTFNLMLWAYVDNWIISVQLAIIGEANFEKLRNLRPWSIWSPSDRNALFLCYFPLTATRRRASSSQNNWLCRHNRFCSQVTWWSKDLDLIIWDHINS